MYRLHNAFRGVKLHRLQLLLLKRFCRKHELDTQLIDQSLSYSENMDYLKGLLGSSVQELASQYGRAYRDYEDSLKHYEKFGVDFSRYETTIAQVRGMMYKVVIKYRFTAIRLKAQLKAKYSRKRSEVIEGRIDLCFPCPFVNCKSRLKLNVKRKAIIMVGTRQAVNDVLMRLDKNHIRHKVVKIKVLTKDKQYVQGLGWVEKP